MEGWLEKNKDALQDGLASLMRSSSISILSSVFALPAPSPAEAEEARSDGPRRKKKGSVAAASVSREPLCAAIKSG